MFYINTFHFFIIIVLAISESSANLSAVCIVNDDYRFPVTRNVATNLKETCPKNTTVATVKGQLFTINENFVNQMEQLSDLKLENLSLEEIEEGTFTNLPKLVDLKLGQNNLKRLKSGIFENLSVKNIDLTNNSISHLDPQAFKNLPNAEQIRLRFNNLTELKKGVFENVSLTFLDLRDNHFLKLNKGVLSGLYPKFATLGVVLWVSSNKLEEIDREVFDFENLKTLSFKNNSISKIRPGDLINLPNLRILHLDGNKLEEITDGVFNGTGIVYLDLSRNKINKISTQAFHHMKKLRGIQLNDNNLKVWDPDWFTGCPSMFIITVSKNRIVEIPEAAFKNFQKNGSSFDFSYNGIRTISSGAFHGLSSLGDVYFKNNSLEEWSEDLLKNVQGESLDLSGNAIKCPENGLQTVAPSFQQVLLYECTGMLQNRVFGSRFDNMFLIAT